MAAPNYAGQGWVARTLSKARFIIDSNLSDVTGPRFGRYQEQVILAPMVGEPLLCDEGSLFVSSMLQGATSLQLGLSASYSATAPAFIFKNNAPVGPQSPRCHLREIHLTVTTAPTSATALNYSTGLDNINRAPTTVSALGSPATATAYAAPAYASNIDESPTANGVWYFPQSTAAGAPPAVPAQGSNFRTLVGNGILRTVIPAANDEYRIVFGATDKLVASATGANTKAGTVGWIFEPHVAVTVGPQSFFLLYLWAPSNATAGIAFSQVDVSWFER